MTMSPPSLTSIRFLALSHRPFAGGASLASASVSFFGSSPSLPTTYVEASSSPGLRQEKYSFVESPDQRRLEGGYPTRSGSRMMLSMVSSTRAGALAAGAPFAAPGACAEGEEIVRAARKAAAIPTLNRFIDV